METLFNIPPVQPEAKIKFQKASPSLEQIKRTKRKFNASYRLRKKIGSGAFPQKSKIIFADIDNNEIENIKEVRILIKENGFIVQPLAFTNL